MNEEKYVGNDGKEKMISGRQGDEGEKQIHRSFVSKLYSRQKKREKLSKRVEKYRTP